MLFSCCGLYASKRAYQLRLWDQAVLVKVRVGTLML